MIDQNELRARLLALEAVVDVLLALHPDRALITRALDGLHEQFTTLIAPDGSQADAALVTAIRARIAVWRQHVNAAPRPQQAGA